MLFAKSNIDRIVECVAIMEININPSIENLLLLRWAFPFTSQKLVMLIRNPSLFSFAVWQQNKLRCVFSPSFSSSAAVAAAAVAQKESDFG